MPVPSAFNPAPVEPALIERLVAGDERALGELYDRYGTFAYSLACAMVRDPADAEEVVAEAFAQIWRSASTFDGSRGNVLAWITTIVRTRALDFIRASRRRSRMIDQAAALSDDTTSPGLSTGPEPADRGVEQSEAAALVRRSLAELPAAQRIVLELAYFSGLSQSEIAERLAEPLGTVKTRMRAGMEKLRQALRPLMGASA
jgi:RNA polymerase sigma-70 factor, ECF subfamily